MSVIRECMPKHRKTILKLFKKNRSGAGKDLDLHLIVDNYRTQKGKRIQKWLAKHPRIHFHFTLHPLLHHMVERFLWEQITTKMLPGCIYRVESVIHSIMDYLEKHNRNPKK
jgi:hypothetical protein